MCNVREWYTYVILCDNVHNYGTVSRWPVLSLAVSSFHRQCTVNVLIITELARGYRWKANLVKNISRVRN